jgi:hypothetical protein
VDAGSRDEHSGFAGGCACHPAAEGLMRVGRTATGLTRRLPGESGRPFTRLYIAGLGARPERSRLVRPRPAHRNDPATTSSLA